MWCWLSGSFGVRQLGRICRAVRWINQMTTSLPS
jgi:hypothetical protein